MDKQQQFHLQQQPAGSVTVSQMDTTNQMNNVIITSIPGQVTQTLQANSVPSVTSPAPTLATTLATNLGTVTMGATLVTTATTSQKPTTPQSALQTTTDTQMIDANALTDTQTSLATGIEIKSEIKTEDSCGKGSISNGKSESNVDVKPDITMSGDGGAGGKIIKSEDSESSTGGKQVKEEPSGDLGVKKEVKSDTEGESSTTATTTASTSGSSSSSSTAMPATGVPCKKKGNSI